MWASQGSRFQDHNSLWTEARADGKTHMPKATAEDFLEVEAQSLVARYHPLTTTSVADLGIDDPITRRCNQLGELQHVSASLHEEQERELSPEIEEERQIQRPLRAEPARHSIHPDLRRFVSTGMLRERSKAFRSVFEALSDSSAMAHLDVKACPRGLLVSSDFATTIQSHGSSSYVSDSYQRSVQWIVTGRPCGDTAAESIENVVAISPYEAHELLPVIVASKAVHLHIYAPRPNMAFRALDSLDLYTVPEMQTLHRPRSLIAELNIFAGQSYFKSFRQYAETCDFLGLKWRTDSHKLVLPDGSALWDGTSKPRDYSQLGDGVAKFLGVLMTTIRRNCEAIDKTHVGRVLDGRLLYAEDFNGDSIL